MFVPRTAAVRIRAWSGFPRAEIAPIAAEHQIVAAVFKPLTLPLSLKITPAPRNPTPDTT
jgi:hypothetical protein